MTSLRRTFFCLPVAVYPNFPKISPPRLASARRARRTRTSPFNDVISLLPFSAQPFLHGLAFQLAKRVRTNPPRCPQIFLPQTPRHGNRCPIQLQFPLPDIPQYPVHSLRHEIPLVRGLALYHLQEAQILCVPGGLVPVRKIRSQSKAAPLLKFIRTFGPRERFLPGRVRKHEKVAAGPVAAVPIVKIPHPQLHLCARNLPRLADHPCQNLRILNSSRPQLQSQSVILPDLLGQSIQFWFGNSEDLLGANSITRHSFYIVFRAKPP